MQDVEFFALVLNTAEELLGVDQERHQTADSNRPGDYAQPANPIEQRNAPHAEKFDGREKERESINGVLVGLHVHAIEFLELGERFPLAVEELYDRHSADVFLQEGIGSGTRGADPAGGVR